MLRGVIGIWTSFLVLSPATAAYTVDEYSKNSKYDIQEGERLSSKLYERCLEMDTEACVGYKLLRSAVSYFQQTKGNELAETSTDKGSEGQVDDILLEKFLQLVTPSSIWTTNRPADSARRFLRLKKKMLFPLLLGVVLKFVSLIPAVLGKLAFAGTVAVMASKLSLLLVSIVGLKKLFTGSDGGMSQQGHHYDEGHYGYYGGSGQHPHKRVAYVVRGRRLEEQEDWTPSIGVESRGFVTGHREGRFGNVVEAEGVESQGYLVQSIGSENRASVSSGMSVDRKKNDDKQEESRKLREPETSKLTAQRPDVNTESSRRTVNHEEHKEENLTEERSQLRHMDKEPYETNRAHHVLDPDARSYGNSATVMPHEALKIRGSSRTDGMTSVTDTTHDEKSEDAERGYKVTVDKRDQGKGAQNKGIRLVKRHYGAELEGQNHDRPYSAGQRRLDEVEGQRVDAWVIRRKMSRA